MADFTRADLRGSRFERVDLSGAQLRAVDLTGARFRGVDLSGVVMRGVELLDVDIHGEIENVTINGVDIGPARHGRGHLTLHLPEGWHREHEWMTLFAAACGPPAAAA